MCHLLALGSMTPGHSGPRRAKIWLCPGVQALNGPSPPGPEKGVPRVLSPALAIYPTKIPEFRERSLALHLDTVHPESAAGAPCSRTLCPGFLAPETQTPLFSKAPSIH